MATDEGSSALDVAKRSPFSNTLRWVVAIASVFPIAVFGVLAFIRLTYPYELEWLESEMLVHVQRLVSGEPIYLPPSAEAVQLPYAPLIFGFSALLGQVFTIDFQLMRIISILATLTTLWILYRIVVGETNSRTGGLIAAGIYAASYRIAGTFYDVAKADALFIMLSVAALGMARLNAKKWHPLAAGALMALAILTKQTALFLFLPIALYLLVTRWRSGVVFVGFTTAITVATTLVLHLVTDGWYTFFVWELLFQHDVEQSARLGFLQTDLMHYWPAFVVVGATALIWTKRRHWWSTGYFVFSFVGLIAGAWSARLHSGGYDNVLMPAILGVALVTGLAVGHMFGSDMDTTRSKLRGVAVVGMCVLQLVFLRYDVNAQIPTDADRASGDAFTQRLAEIQGDVLVLSHPGYALMTGKSDEPGKGGTEDILRGNNSEAQRELLDSFAEAIYQQRWNAIVLDDQAEARVFPADWKNFYYESPEELVADGTFAPVVNGIGIPRQLWLPRPDIPDRPLSSR